MPLSDVANVNINLQDPPSSLAGFGIPLILHTLTAPQDALFPGGARFVEIARESWEATMATLGITSGEAAYIDSRQMFNQAIAPQKAYLGRRAAAVAYASTATVGGAADGNYVTTVSAVGETKIYTFVALSDTVTTIRDGILALIAGDTSTLWGAVTSATDMIDFTATAAGYPLTISLQSPGSDYLNVVSTPHHGVDTDITEVDAEVNDWYMLVNGSVVDSDIHTGATAIESGPRRMHAYYTQDADILVGATTTDLMSILQAASLARSFGLHRPAATDGSASSWVGRCIPALPGTINWRHKSLVLITGRNYSQFLSERSAITAKGGNYVELFPALNPPVSNTQGLGVVADGTQIDVIRGIDNLFAEILIRQFNLFNQTDKVPYDNDGMSQVHATAVGATEFLTDQGVLEPLASDAWTVPDISTATAAERQAGAFPAISFVAAALKSGGSVTINGTITN